MISPFSVQTAPYGSAGPSNGGATHVRRPSAASTVGTPTATGAHVGSPNAKSRSFETRANTAGSCRKPHHSLHDTTPTSSPRETSGPPLSPEQTDVHVAPGLL